MTDALMTPDDLAARWQRPVKWVREQAAAGTIPALNIGGLWRFKPDAIDLYEQRKATADPLTLTRLSAARSARTRRK